MVDIRDEERAFSPDENGNKAGHNGLITLGFCFKCLSPLSAKHFLDTLR